MTDDNTKDQIAAVMLLKGTPKQQEEVLEYCKIKTPSQFKTISKDTLNKIHSELISACSSLNMQPSPISKEKQHIPNQGFLTDTDVWASHAYDHIITAIKLLIELKYS